MKQITLSLRTESDETARGTAASRLQALPKREGRKRPFIMKEQQQIRAGADFFFFFFTRAVFNNAFIILELQEQCL